MHTLGALYLICTHHTFTFMKRLIKKEEKKKKNSIIVVIVFVVFE